MEFELNKPSVFFFIMLHLKMSNLGWKVKYQLDLWYLSFKLANVSLGYTCPANIIILG